MNDIISKIAETGTVTIPTAEYWTLLRAQRDLEIIRKAYDITEYSTLDKNVAESVFGPKRVPKPEPEPAPDPIEQALTAALSAAESAKKAADMAAKMAAAAMGEDDHA